MNGRSNVRRIDRDPLGRFWKRLCVGVGAWIVAASASWGAAQGPPDREVQHAVEDLIADHPGAVPGFIEVRVQQGKAVLSGTLPTLYSKREAERLAKRVRGVRDVDNEIHVAAAPRPDADLRGDVQAALLADPSLEGRAFSVGADHGVVTLSGTVSSRAEAGLAQEVAGSVSGVRDVIDRLEVRPGRQPSDSGLAAEVESRIHWDGAIEPREVLVEVKNRRVVLRGAVQSVADKDQVIADAWVPGVSDVDASALKIQPYVKESESVPAAGAPDDAVREAVVRALGRDPLTADLSDQAEVRGGTATLRGTVKFLSARIRAGRIAESVAGVRHVKNRVRVRPPGGIRDDAIEASIRKSFARDSLLHSYDLAVKVAVGHVLLGGSVASEQDRRRAEQLASMTAGVIAVSDRLDLGLAPDSIFAAGTKDDWEFADDVRGRLYWSPYLAGSDIGVSVEGGTVTLSGEVDTRRQERVAVSEAYDTGARQVVNKLKARVER